VAHSTSGRNWYSTLRKNGARQLIVNYLNKYKGVAFSCYDLAQIIGASVPTVRKEVSCLTREGLIEKEKNPQYCGRYKPGEPKYFYYIKPSLP